jgi:hypothetical protein
MIRVALATAIASLGPLSALALGPGGALPADAAAAPITSGAPTIEASFTPDRAGARTAARFAANLSGVAEGVPEPLRKVVVLAPAGLSETVEWPTTVGCSPRALQRRGVRGCPARSQVGSGSALVAWREGSRTVTEHARLWAFLGSLSDGYKFQILGEGTSPIRRRTVMTVSLAALSGIYSTSLETFIPPIPTRPGEPDASVVSFSITMGNGKRPRFSGPGVYGGLGLFVPSPCPAGGYPWSSEFTYAGGAVQQATTTAPCP